MLLGLALIAVAGFLVAVPLGFAVLGAALFFAGYDLGGIDEHPPSD